MDKDFWEKRYKNGETGWDTGSITPPLKEYLEQLKTKEISILIPGCGNAHEAEWLLQNGFSNITLIDISEVLVNELKEKFQHIPKADLRILNQDFFRLENKYDLILEQTFLCALDPARRKDYVLQMKKLLKEDGKLVGVLFDREFGGGPPFSGSLPEFRILFKDHLKIVKLERCYNSIPPRKGTEVFMILEEKPL